MKKLILVIFVSASCGYPPEADVLQTDPVEQHERKVGHHKSNIVVVSAITVGAGAALCYLTPVIRKKCPEMVKDTWRVGKAGVAKISDKIDAGGKKLWRGIKKPFRKSEQPK